MIIREGAGLRANDITSIRTRGLRDHIPKLLFPLTKVTASRGLYRYGIPTSRWRFARAIVSRYSTMKAI